MNLLTKSIDDSSTLIENSNKKIETLLQSIKADISFIESDHIHRQQCLEADRERYQKALKLYNSAETIIGDFNDDLLVRAFSNEKNRDDFKIYNAVSPSLADLWAEESKIFDAMSEASNYTRRYIQRILLQPTLATIRKEVRYGKLSKVKRVIAFAKLMIIVSDHIASYAVHQDEINAGFNADLAFHLRDATLSALSLFFLDNVYDIYSGKVSTNRPGDLIMSLMMLLAQAQDQWSFDLNFAENILYPLSQSRSIYNDMWASEYSMDEIEFFSILSSADISYDLEYIEGSLDLKELVTASVRSEETQLYAFTPKIIETVDAVFLRSSLIYGSYRNAYIQEVLSEVSESVIARTNELAKTATQSSLALLANGSLAVAEFITISCLTQPVEAHLTSIADSWYKESFKFTNKISKVILSSLSKQLSSGIRLITTLLTGQERIGDLNSAFMDVTKSYRKLDSLHSSLHEKLGEIVSTDLNNLIEQQLISLLSKVTAKNAIDIDYRSMDNYVDAVHSGLDKGDFDITRFDDLVRLINDKSLREEVTINGFEASGLTCSQKYANQAINMLK